MPSTLRRKPAKKPKRVTRRQLEDRKDLAAARRAMKEKGAVPLEVVLHRLGV
jgi:hypothetical protein